MTELEKAYIAGLIDGEGSIMLQKVHYFHQNKPVSLYQNTMDKCLPETFH